MHQFPPRSGVITNCGEPVPNASVLLLVQQDLQEQARPVDTQIGPVTTTRDGAYAFDISPSFAVPGAARMQLQVTTGGMTDEIEGGTLEFRMGSPPRDTARFDVDLGNQRRACYEAASLPSIRIRSLVAGGG